MISWPISTWPGFDLRLEAPDKKREAPVGSPAPYLRGQNQYDRFVSHQYPGNSSVVLGPHFLAGADRFWMGSHTRIVRVEARCTLFWLTF